MYGLRVVLAEGDPSFRKQIKEILLQAGCIIIGEVADGRTALQMTFNFQPDLLIINTQLPGRTGVEVAKIIAEQQVAPVLLISENEDHAELKALVEHWLVSYLIKPIDAVNLYPAIEVYLAMFKKLCRLEEENRKLKQTIETRKVLERAKGLLIEIKGMTEQQAFKYIQKLSMDKCLPIQNVSKQIIKILDGRLKEGGLK